MAQQIHASIRCTLPNDPVEMAETLSKLAAAWQQFSATVKDTGLTLDEQTFSMLAARSSKRRRRRLEAVQPPSAA